MSRTRSEDRYDLEIEDIKKEVARGLRPVEDVIYDHWTGYRDLGGLFSYCSPTRRSDSSTPGMNGCLTQIKFSPSFHAVGSKLTKAIRRSSLPGEIGETELRHLPQFARWQRKMDAMWPGRGEMLMPEGFEQRLREARKKATTKEKRVET